MRTPSYPHLAIPKKLADQKRAERVRNAMAVCPVCKQACRNDEFRCRECGSQVVVGELVSQGSGNIPRGHAFALRARDYIVGRSLAADYIIPDEQLPNELFELRYLAPDRFAIVFDRSQELIFINNESAGWNYRLEDGDIIRFAAETFIYRHEPIHISADRSEQERLRLQVERYRMLMRIIQTLHQSADFGALCRHSVHSVLKVTRLARAVFFLVEEDESGDSYLRQYYSATQEQSGRIDDTDILRVSQSILSRALSDGGTIVIEDTGTEVDRSRSMMALDLRSLVCVPFTVPTQALPVEERRYQPAYCLGMIYADSVDPLQEIPPDTREFLALIAQTLSFVMLQWEIVGRQRSS